MLGLPSPRPRFGASLLVASAVLATLTVSCTRTPEEKSAKWIRSAQSSMERKDYDRAIVELQNAIQTTPANAEAHYQMGLALMGKETSDKAAFHFKRAADFDQSHTGARLKLAQLLSDTGDRKLLAAAEEYATAALEQRPGDPEILHALAVAEWRLEKIQPAIEHLQQALAIDPAHLKSSSTLSLVQFSAKRDAAAAERTLRKAVERLPGSAEAFVNLGSFYALTGRQDAAEAQFRKAIEIDPNYAPALLQLSTLQQRAGRLDEVEQTLLQLSSLPDGSYRTIHALFLFQGGQPDRAIAELKRIHAEEPGNTDVRARLVEAYLATDRLDEAERTLTEALRKNRHDLDALEQQGRLHLRKQRFKEAEETLKEVIQRRPQSVPAAQALARAYRAQGQGEDSVRELRRILDIDPFLLDIRLELSAALRNSRDLRGAMSAIETTPDAQKQDVRWLIERGWVLLALGRTADARPVVAKSLATSRTPATLLQAGLLEINEKNHSAGRALFEEALRAAPDNVEALASIAHSFATEGKPAEATERIRRQSELAAKSAPIQVVLGNLHERSRDVTAARAAYRKALEVDSSYAPAAIALARLDMLEGRWDEARKDIQAVLARNKRHVEALLALGMIEDGAGRNEAAIDAYREVLKVQPDHAIAKNNLAVRLSEIPNSRSEALMLAWEVKQALPKNPEFDDTLGLIYLRMNQHNEAIKHLEAAAARMKGARTRYYLAMAYFGAGQPDLGQKTLAAALAIDPNLPEAKQARQMAESAR